MDYLVKDEKLELKYEPGKGAWTYHLQIPNTKHIIGKWGSLNHCYLQNWKYKLVYHYGTRQIDFNKWQNQKSN